jgi:CHAT domain-containing protein
MIFRTNLKFPVIRNSYIKKLAFLLLCLPLLSSSFSKELNNLYKINDRSENGGKSKEGVENSIIIPFYPFKHELTIDADSLFLNDYNEEALVKYQKARDHFLYNKNWEGVGYTGNMIAEIYTNRLTNSQLAEEALKESEETIKSHLGVEHPLLSDTYMTYGSLMERTGYAEKAKKYLFNNLLNRSDYFGQRSIQMAELNYRIGQYYQYSIQDLDLTIEYYNRALIVFEEYLSSNHPDLIKVYYALGSNYRYKEDFQRSIIYLDHALYNYFQDSLSNAIRIATSQLVKANTLNDMRQYKFSLNLYKSAINSHVEILGPDHWRLILAYIGYGVALFRTEKYEKALQIFDRSLDIYKLYYSTSDPIPEFTSILINKGETFAYMQKEDSAKYYLFKALDLNKKKFREDYSGRSFIYYAIAHMYLQLEKTDSAIYYSQKSLTELVPSFSSMDIRDNPGIEHQENPVKLIELLAFKAKILMSMYDSDYTNIKDLKYAINIFDLIDRLTDNIRNSNYGEESKLIMTADFHKIYENSIKCSKLLYEINHDEIYLEKALNFFEKNKYMLLFHNLELARKSNELNLPFDLRFKEDSLKLKRAEFEQKIKMDDPQSVSRISVNMVEIDKSLTEIRTEIESTHPNFFNIDKEKIEIKLDVLKNYAKSSQSLLIEFFEGESTIYVLGIDGEQISLEGIKITDDLHKNINDFLYTISSGQQTDSIQAFYNKYIKSANYLYTHILSSVLSRHQISDGDQIIISSDGMLAEIPFEALLQNTPRSNYPNYASLDYLIHKYNISYVYSFNLFFKQINKKSTGSNNLLAFSYSNIEVSSNPEKRSGDMVELPGTNKETESIRKIIKGNNLFLENENATESEFKIRSNDYQILHLAVHGMGDYESSINSRLVFKNKLDSLNDGNLFLYEVYNLNLNNSRLAILSACETGIGKEFKGEGIFSMARGFARAGCPAIIMSLWKVNDIVSAELMTEFYKNLKKGKKINESLRAAKVHYIKNADPSAVYPGNWAAFVPLGQVEAIYNNKINLFIIIGLILSVFLILIILLRRKLFSKN